MPLAFLLEKIFMVFFVGVLVGFWKIMTSFFSAIEESTKRMNSERESQRAFGKLDHEIEIYEPEKVDKDAD